MKAPEVLFDLPWPAPGLSPNARIHWAARSRLTKAARAAAGLIARRASANVDFRDARRVGVRLVFVPPDRRRRDGHNLAAAMKAAIDGIADAIQVDDSRFIVSHELADTTAPRGLVWVSLWAAS